MPFTSFSENEALSDGSHPPAWFALDGAWAAILLVNPVRAPAAPEAPHLRSLWSEVANNVLAETGDEGRAVRAAGAAVAKARRNEAPQTSFIRSRDFDP